MHVTCYGLGVTESGETLSGIFQEHYQDIKHSYTLLTLHSHDKSAIL